MIVEVALSEFCRIGWQARDPGKNSYCSLSPKTVWRQYFLFLWDFSLLSLKPFNWLDEAHSQSGRSSVYSKSTELEVNHWASLVAQWLGICLPMQGTRVWALVREDPTCRGATKPVGHNYWACSLEPTSHNYWSPHTTATEAREPRAHALQQEKPPQWEACALQWRVAPTRRN